MRNVTLAVLTLALVTSACGDDDGAVRAAGTVEVVEVDVAPLQPARVVRMWVDEGDTVRAGDTLATLTLSTTHGEVGVREAQLEGARARLSDLEAGARPEEIGKAQADLAAAEAEAARAARDADRLRPLADQAVSRQEYDRAVSAARVAAARRDAAREALRLVRSGARSEQVEGARAEVATAAAALEASRATEGELTLTAAVDGEVIGRWAEPGESVAAGEAVLSLGETGRPWTRVYVDARTLPGVRVGQEVTAVLDGVPGRSFRGRVASIRGRAEFTPRVALTETERADLLFAVRVELRDQGGLLRAGLPVTVTFPPSPDPR